MRDAGERPPRVRARRLPAAVRDRGLARRGPRPLSALGRLGERVLETDSFFLRVEPPAAAPYRVECDGDSVVVGRSSSADVHVADRFLSRKHARLYRQADGWYVETLSTRSPTLLNGTAVGGPTRVKPGDVLRLAETVVRIAPGRERRRIGPQVPRRSRAAGSSSRRRRCWTSRCSTADPVALERQTSRMAAPERGPPGPGPADLPRGPPGPGPRPGLRPPHPRGGRRCTCAAPTASSSGPPFRRVPGLEGEPFHSRRLAEEVVGNGAWPPWSRTRASTTASRPPRAS